MNIRVKLLEYTKDGERLVAAAAKQTIKREPVDPSKLGDDEVEVWIKETFRRQHWSPWEFSTYTFLVEGCSRVCSHQLVRHRMASYAQQSMRYSEGYLRRLALEACRMIGRNCPEKPAKREDYLAYAEAIDGIIESMELYYGDFNDVISLARIAYVIPRQAENRQGAMAMQYLRATATYYYLLANGVRREDARYVIPQAVRTAVYVRMNARELATVFLPLRMCTRAQWEIRHVAWAMWRELLRVHPVIFRYVGPRCVLLENTVRDAPVPLIEYLEGKKEFTIQRCPELVPRRGIPACISHAMGDAGHV